MPRDSYYRDPVLGRLDHADDHDDPERPTLDDLRGLEPREQRFTRVYDEATSFAWLVSRDNAHRMARRARQNDAARPDSHSGRAA